WSGGPANASLPFAVVRQPWPGPLLDTASNVAPTSHEPGLAFLPDSASSRYLEDFSKATGPGLCFLARDPLTSDYYNWGQFQKPSEDDDDTNSYENVLICKQDTKSGETAGPHCWAGRPPGQLAALPTGRGGCPTGPALSRCLPAGDEGSEDYQNSASIWQWRESRRVLEQGQRDAPLSLAGSPDEEPDYVNESVAA
ncbi:NTAL protein, partial [Crocuta crocuta]